MDPEDDWAPLPPETVPLGEAAKPRPKYAHKVVPQPALRPIARGAAASAPTAAERQLADEQLAALQQRLAATPRATDDPVGRAVSRASRKAALSANFAGEPPPTVPGAPAMDAVPGVHRVAYGVDRDPREDEPWFLQLPTAEQQRLRSSWHRTRHRFDGRRPAFWRDVRRAAWQGALVFFVVGLLQVPTFGVAAIPRFALAGAVAAPLGRLAGGGRFAFALVGFLALALVSGANVLAVLFSPIGLPSALIACHGMALLGFDREMQRSGGFDEKQHTGPPGTA